MRRLPPWITPSLLLYGASLFAALLVGALFGLIAGLRLAPARPPGLFRVEMQPEQFLAVYPDGALAEASIEVYQGKQLIAKRVVARPPADASGRRSLRIERLAGETGAARVRVGTLPIGTLSNSDLGEAGLTFSPTRTAAATGSDPTPGERPAEIPPAGESRPDDPSDEELGDDSAEGRTVTAQTSSPRNELELRTRAGALATRGDDCGAARLLRGGREERTRALERELSARCNSR